MTNNVVINFLKENLQRLFIKMPVFFKIWTGISMVLLLITGLPDFITMLPVGITIPDIWNNYITIAVRYASSGMLFMALLTTQSKPVAVTSEGNVLKETNVDKLPFTASREAKAAIKSDVPTVHEEEVVEVLKKKSVINKTKT